MVRRLIILVIVICILLELGDSAGAKRRAKRKRNKGANQPGINNQNGNSNGPKSAKIANGSGKNRIVRVKKHVKADNLKRFKTNKNRNVLADEAAILKKLGLNSRLYSLEFQWARNMSNGNKKARIRQLYLGVPVYGANIVAEQDPISKGYFKDSVQAVWYTGAEKSVKDAKTKISEKEAIALLLQANGQQKSPAANAKARLWLFPEEGSGAATMSYKVSYFVGFDNSTRQSSKQETYSRPTGFVNAFTGEIYENFCGLAHLQKPFKTTGITGNTQTGQKMEDLIVMKEGVDGTCFYNQSFRAGKFLTLHDSRKSQMDAANFKCSDAANPSYDQINGAFSPMNSAFKYASETIKLFIVTLDVPPTDDNLRILAHYPGKGAAWTGTEVYVSDGEPINFFPFDQPDVISHEVAHAFTESQSGLEVTGQQGAINEAYSDMAAMAVLDRLYKQQPFAIGQSVTRNKLPLRDLCDPSRIGNGVDHMSKLPSIIEVHDASGIYSKVFCLLAKNNRWTLQQTFKVFTYANSVYWKARSTFASAACGVQSAAADLGANVDDVTQAFQSVGITCIPG